MTALREESALTAERLTLLTNVLSEVLVEIGRVQTELDAVAEGVGAGLTAADVGYLYDAALHISQYGDHIAQAGRALPEAIDDAWTNNLLVADDDPLNMDRFERIAATWYEERGAQHRRELADA